MSRGDFWHSVLEKLQPKVVPRLSPSFTSSSTAPQDLLDARLGRINVDEKNCFGMIEWNTVREAAGHFLPKHAATAGWKHRALSHVEQEGLLPMPKDRGAEQGDVDGPSGVQLGPGTGGGRDVRKHSRVAGGGHPPLNMLRDCRSQQTSSLVAQKKVTGAHNPQHALKKS